MDVKRGVQQRKNYDRDSKKKPAQIKKNDNCATHDVKVQEGTTKGRCVAGPVLTRAQAKKSDTIHPLTVKEAMSSVDTITIEDLQVGKPIIRENYVRDFFMKNGLLYRKHQETKIGRNSNQLGTSTTGYVCEPQVSI